MEVFIFSTPPNAKPETLSKHFNILHKIELMKYLICTLLLFTILQSCNENIKYEMYNMMPELVDVTELIESGEYIPDSCNGRIDKLIKVSPKVLDESYEIELEKRLINLKTEYLKSHKLKANSLYRNTVYEYSYLIDFDPIDVYKTKIIIEPNIELDIFIRLDKTGKIYSDFSETNWVTYK